MLQQTIDAAKTITDNFDNYVDKGKAEFTQALEQAKAILEKPKATQEEINAAIDKLVGTMLNLRLKADKSILNQTIAAAETIDLSDYSMESVTHFNDALNKAKEASADETLSTKNQVTVDAAERALREAVAGLENADGTPANMSINADGTVSNTTGNVKTGENTPIAMAAVVMLFAATAVIIKKRKL